MAFSDDRWGLYIGLVITILSISAMPLVIIYKKRHFPGLRHRGVILTILNGVLPMMYMCILTIRMVIETPITCIMDVWVSTTISTLYGFLLITRSFRVIFLYHVSEARYRMTRSLSETSGFSVESDADANTAAAASSVSGNERQHKLVTSLSASSMQKSNQNRRRLFKSWKSHEHLDTHSKRLPPILRKLPFTIRETPSTKFLRKKKSRSERGEKTELTDEYSSQADLVEMENIHVVEHKMETSSCPKGADAQRSSHLSVEYPAEQSYETRNSENDSEATTTNGASSSTCEVSPTTDNTQWSPGVPSSKNIKFDFLSIKPEKPNYTWIYRHRHWIRTPFIMRGFFIALIVQVAINTTIQVTLGPGPLVTPSTAILCHGSSQYLALYIIGLTIGCILTCIVIFPLRRVNDAFFIRIELMAGTIIAGLCALIGVLTYIYRYADPSEVAIQSYISTASQVFLCIMGYSIAIIFPLIDAIRLDKFSRAASGFAESLANPASFEKFKIFSIIDFSVENVLFYDKVRRLRALAIKKQSTSSCGNGVRRHRSNTTDTAASGEALARRIDKEIRNIYVKFIVPGSEYELNLEHDTRKSIMKAMQQDEFNITLYDAAFNEISSLLINNTYPRFLQWKSGQSKTDDIDDPSYLSRSTDDRRQSAFSEIPPMVVVEKPYPSHNNDNK